MYSFLEFSKKYEKDIYILGAPLWEHGLYTYYSYHRFFPSGVTFGFSSKAEISRVFIESEYVPPMLSKSGPILDEGFYYMRDMADILAGLYGPQAGKKFVAIEKNLNLDQSEAMFYIHRDIEFSEMFFFAVFPPKRGVYYEMLKSTKYLHGFIAHVLDEGNDLIAAAGKKMRTIIPPDRLPSAPKALVEKSYGHQIKRYRFATGNEEIFLTRREFEFLTLLNVGLTLQKIATVMDISFRTVRAHYESLRAKFNTDKKEQIIKIYQNSIYYQFSSR